MSLDSSSGKSASEKRKHVTLTLFEKLDIIEQCEKKEMTKAAIATQYGIGRSTVTDIYNNREQIRFFVENHTNDDVVSKRRKLDKFYLSSTMKEDGDDSSMIKIEGEESNLVEGIEEYEYQEIEDQDYEVVYESSMPVYPVAMPTVTPIKALTSPNKKAPESITASPSSSSNKRKSKTLTFKEKFEIIEQVEAGVAVQLIAQSYDVGKTTIYDFLKRKEEIKSYIQRTQDCERRTFKGSRFPSIEESAIDWCYARDSFTKDELLGFVSTVFEAAKESGQPAPKNGLSKASWWKRFFRRNPQFKCKVFVEDGEPKEFPPDNSLNDSEEKPTRIVQFSEKIAILNMIDKGKDLDDIADQFGVTREIVEDIESRRDLLGNIRAMPKSSDKRRFAKPPSSVIMALQNELLSWCLKQSSFPLDYNDIASKANAIHETYDEKDKDFVASVSWAKRFVMRYPELRLKQGIAAQSYRQHQNESILPDQLIEEDMDADGNNSQFEYLEESEIVEHDPENAEYLEEYIVEEIGVDEDQFTDENVNFIEVPQDEDPLPQQPPPQPRSKPTGMGISHSIALKSLKVLLKYGEQHNHEFILPHLREYQDQLEILNCSL